MEYICGVPDGAPASSSSSFVTATSQQSSSDSGSGGDSGDGSGGDDGSGRGSVSGSGSDSTLRPDDSYSFHSAASEQTLQPDLERQPLLGQQSVPRPLLNRRRRRSSPSPDPEPCPGGCFGVFPEPCFSTFCGSIIILFIVVFLPLLLNGTFEFDDQRTFLTAVE